MLAFSPPFKFKVADIAKALNSSAIVKIIFIEPPKAKGTGLLPMS
jgi:hypothetical protein